jgi:hypothetical protein
VSTAGIVTLVVLLVASLAALVAVAWSVSRRVVRSVETATAAVGRVQERVAALEQVTVVTRAERSALEASMAELRAAREARR